MVAVWGLAVGWNTAMCAGLDERSGGAASPSGLRFKSGPVCMCSGGLSEADIRRAERERNGGSKGDNESEQENRSRGGENQ